MMQLTKKTKFHSSRGKRIWRNVAHGIVVKRCGPTIEGRLSYFLTQRGGWTIIYPDEIQPMIKILTALQADAEGRMK